MCIQNVNMYCFELLVIQLVITFLNGFAMPEMNPEL